MPGILEARVEVDLLTAPAFAAAMRAEIDWAHNRAVFIDCSAIVFMDIGAFHALVYAHRYAIDHGHRLVVRNLSPSCARFVHLCDTDNELTIEAGWGSSAVPLLAFASPASKHRPTPEEARRDNRRSHSPRLRPRSAWCGTRGAWAAPTPHVAVASPTPDKERP
jgi:anti-anti-sigma factor